MAPVIEDTFHCLLVNTADSLQVNIVMKWFFSCIFEVLFPNDVSSYKFYLKSKLKG